MSDYVYEGTALLLLGEHLRNYNAAIADMVASAASRGDRAIDFGAGVGTLTREVAVRIGKPDCVEPDARQRDALASVGFRCFSDIADVPAGAYDFVYSSNVLEHIDDDVGTLHELYRVLRPGGRLLLYVPAFQSLYTAMDAAVGHRRRYDSAMLAERLRRARFRVDRMRYVDMLGYLASIVFKLTSNRLGDVNERTLRLYDSYVFPVTRAIERFISPPFGKNVVAIATREDRADGTAHEAS